MGWGIAAALGLWGASFLYNRYFRDDPFEGKQEKNGRFGIPEVDEGRPAPIFYGRVRIREPAVMSVLNLYPHSVEVGGEVVAYRHNASVQYLIGIPAGGNVVPSTLRKIWINEKEVWSGARSEDDEPEQVLGGILINLPNLFGGPGKGGGIVGQVFYHNGSTTQQSSALLADIMGGPAEPSLDPTLLSAYRGYAHLLFFSTNWGEGSQLPAPSFEVTSYPDHLGLGSKAIIGVDANPVEVIYDLLTEDWGKLGIDTSLIDSASFVTVGNTLYDEGHGISFVESDGRGAVELIAEILDQIGGALRQDPTTRKWYLKLIREDYTVSALPLLNESNCDEENPPQISFTTISETDNEVHLTYYDRASEYAERSIPLEDEQNRTLQDGRRKPVRRTYRGCKTAALAQLLVARELRAVSLPLAHATFTTTQDGTGLLYGDAVRMSWSEYSITDMVFRVISADRGTYEDGRVVLQLIQDQFAYGQDLNDQPVSIPPLSPEPGPVSEAAPFESTRWHNRLLNPGNPGVARIYHIAAAPSSGINADEYTGIADDDSDGVYEADRLNMPFLATAQVHTAVTRGNEPTAAAGLRIKNVSDTSELITALSQAEIGIRYNGTPLILVGPVGGPWEIMAYDGLVNNGDDTYTLDVWRGMLDTRPVAHAVNERVWILKVGSTLGEVEHGLSGTVRVKQITTSGWNTLSEDSADYQDVTLVNRAAKPMPVDDMNVDYRHKAWEPPLDDTKEPAELLASGLNLTWLRRQRALDTIYKPDDADDRDDATATGTAVTYALEGIITGDGPYEPDGSDPTIDANWSTLPDWDGTDPASVDDKQHVGLTVGTDLGHGDFQIRIRSKYTLLGILELDSYQHPTIWTHLARYRNLLVNPSFEMTNSALEGWTTNSGTPAISAGNGIDGGNGVTGTSNEASCQFEQVVDVEAFAPEGMTAYLSGYHYLLTDTGAADTVELRLQALNDALTVLGETGTSSTASSTTVVRLDRTLTCPAGTTKLRVRITLTAVGDDVPNHPNSLIDKLSLRLGQGTGDQLTNGNFDTNTTGWTVSSGSWFGAISGQMCGAGCLQCQSTGTAEIYQDVSVTAEYVGNGTAVVPLHLYHSSSAADRMQVIVEARNSSETVLASASSLDTNDGDDMWHEEVLTVDLPDNTDHVRVRITQTANASASNLQKLDEIALLFFAELHPIHEWSEHRLIEQPEQDFPATAQNWDDTYSTARPTQIHLFDGLDEDATIASEVPSQDGANLTRIGGTATLLGRTFAGILEEGGSYFSKACFEVKRTGSSSQGAQFARAAQFSCDGAGDWTLVLVFRLQGDNSSAEDRLIDSISSGQGWAVGYRYGDGGRLRVTADGTTTQTADLTGADYGRGVPHYLAIQYKSGAGTLDAWTDLEQLGTAITVPANADNLVPLILGGSPTMQGPDAQYAYMAGWQGDSTLTKSDTDAWWKYGQDKDGLEATYNGAAPVATIIDKDNDPDGLVLASYADYHLPIARHSPLTDDGKGLALYKGFTNEVEPDLYHSSWAARGGGSLTVTLRNGPDLQRMNRSVYMSGDDSRWYTSGTVTKAAGNVKILFAAKASSAHSMKVSLLDTTDTADDNDSVVLGTAWAVHEVNLTWSGATAAFRVGFAASNTASVQTCEISGPVLVLYGAGTIVTPPVFALTQATLSASTCDLDRTLAARLNGEGEIAVTGVLTEDPPAASTSVVINAHNGSDDDDRRQLDFQSSGAARLVHYDSAGTGVAGSTAAVNTDAQWKIRGRWNNLGLVNDSAKYAQIHATGVSDVTVRGSSFGKTNNPLTAIRLSDDTNPMDGFISRVEIACRERPLA